MIRRPLWIVTGLLLGAAAALWGASRFGSRDDLDGSGQDAARWLVPFAVLALAGIAGAVALGGWPRRGLGIVLGLIGIGAVALAGLAELPPDIGAGRALAFLAGMMIIAAGALMVVFGARMPRLGSVYQAPGARRRSDDQDTELWQALSEGKDPTTDDR